MSNKKPNISEKAARILKAVKSTKSAPACYLLVKAAIERREQLLKKDPEPGVYKWEKVTDSKSRDRVKKLCKDIMSLTERKDISVLCGACIAQRRLAREE